MLPTDSPAKMLMNVRDSYFTDTNLLLYAVDGREPVKRARALEWISYLWSTGKGRLSMQVLNEFYANAVRKFAIPVSEARERVGVFGEWKPGGISLELIELAWRGTDHAQVTHWDALILASAEEQGCRWLLSEDFQAGRRYGNIEVINPFQTAPPDLNGAGLH